MSTKKELQDKIKNLDDQKKPLEKELQKIYESEEKEVNDRIELCLQNKGKFELDELRFAAFSRCECGAGLAYPKNIGIHGSWYCSAILLGDVDAIKIMHSAPLPFTFYEVKSEDQPSANGATTRPKK